MLTILGITGPIFILIAIGFVAVRRGTLARNEIRALGSFVINFALPALLFKAMAERSVDNLVNVDLLLIYALGSLAVAGGVIAVACLVFKQRLQAGAILAMGMAVSNSAYIGFPIAQQLIGPAASANLAIYAVVETLIMLPLLMSLAELGGDSGRHWARVLLGILGRLLKNPMFMSIVAGVAFSLLGLHLPLPLARVVDMLAAASAPVALFYIGGILATLSLKGMAGDIGRIVAGKLILHPLVVAGIFLVHPFDDPQLRNAAIINAGMPMMSIYPILGQKYGKEGVCAAALVATTVVSFFTISALLWLTGAG